MKSPELSPLSLTFIAAALLALGIAVQAHNGSFSLSAVSALACAWLLVIAASAALPWPAVIKSHRLEQAPRFALLVTLAAMGGMMLSSPVLVALRGQPQLAVKVALLTGSLLGGSVILARERESRWAFYALLLWHFLLGLWLLGLSRDPHIDVFVFQEDAARALLAGHNPYAITFANIYHSDIVYGPGLTDGERLFFGYPYPPLSLLLVVPATVLGDPRYAQLTAYTLSALIIAHARNTRTSFAAAAVFLLLSRGFFVLEQSWTEPLALLFLAASLWTAVRAPRWLAVPLGFLFASKQYLVVILPLVLLLAERSPGKTLVLLCKAGLVTALITLPLALWDWPAFFHSVVGLQVAQPYRPDALSFLNCFAALRTPLLAFALLVPALALALWRSPASPAGFALSTALVLITFFAWNKQAFCNYYFFALGALCMALAIGDSSGARTQATALRDGA